MLSPDTIAIQNKLGDFCRTGIMPEIPGINIPHIKHYRRLIFNVVSQNIRQAYPIARKVVGEVQFREMCDEFFQNHPAQTTQIWKLPGEFYTYAVKAGWSKKYKQAWLDDLLLFEWSELRIFTMPDGQVPRLARQGDLLRDKLVLNPDSEILELHYPVHLQAIKDIEQHKGNYYLLVFRERDTGRVRFVNLSIFYAYLLQRLSEEKTLSGQALQEAFHQFGITGQQEYTEATRAFFEDLSAQGYLLGFEQP